MGNICCGTHVDDQRRADAAFNVDSTFMPSFTHSLSEGSGLFGPALQTSNDASSVSLQHSLSNMMENQFLFPPEQQERRHIYLMEQKEALTMQIDTLKSLNAQCQVQLMQVLNHPHYVPSGAGGGDENASHLMHEMQKRSEDIRSLRRLVNAVVVELRRRGLPATRQPEETAFQQALEEDPSLCQYCLSNPASVVYTCCNHQGACAPCAKAIHQENHRCPHCRADNPKVTLPSF